MTRARAAGGRLFADWRALPVAHRLILIGAMALAAALVVAYAIATRPNTLAGDQAEYDMQGRFFTEGRWWWSTIVTGEPHASAWKAPGYPLWVGFWYSIVGPGTAKLAIIQGLLLTPLSVLLVWLIARRWFGLTVAAVSAVVFAVLPLNWEFYGLLYSEALAIPLGLLIVYLGFSRREISTRRAIAIGALIGLCMLIKPTSFFLFAGLLGAWIVAAGWRTGIGRTVVAVLAAVVVLVPWAVRNAVVLDAFVPLSLQDSAAFGTFNDEAASDEDFRWGWRQAPFNEVLSSDGPFDEVGFRAELQNRTREFISENPSSVPKAFVYNGLIRLWDVRSPSDALVEVPFQGRSQTVARIGLYMHYVLLPLALIGLVRLRRRPELLVPIVLLAVALSVIYTAQGGTRYRTPMQPLIVVLACSNLTLLPRFREKPEPPPLVPGSLGGPGIAPSS